MAIQSSLIGAIEAAEIVGVSKGRLLEFVRLGRIRPKGQIGSAFAFDPSEIREFAKIKRKNGRPEKDSENNSDSH